MPNRKLHQFFKHIEHKHCPTCDRFKILEDFTKQSSSWDKLCRMCRQCMQEYKRHKRQTDTKYQISDSNYNEYCKKSGKRREKSQQRYKAKREEIIQQCMKYQRYKYRTDGYYRLVANYRKRVDRELSSAIKYKSVKNSSLELIGCSVKMLIQYIERQFSDGMSWDNYGLHTWHIDHIRPVSSFDLTNIEDVKKCFHYTNLQPLWAKDNLQKSNKF